MLVLVCLVPCDANLPALTSGWSFFANLRYALRGIVDSLALCACLLESTCVV